MGAIGGEELTRWEKMQRGMSAHDEKILVLVRLRPLSEKEIARDEVSDWECINDTAILYRNSLQERSGLPTAYNFDRVFRGDCSTKEVYEEGAKEIALSVVGGINSTIFAYGQTGSGKTYTMMGITEYTVADIYDYIHRHEERAFVLKFSAMEIYNEAVRDLLSTDSTPLRILDDLEKGTIVEKLTEETLRDWSHLKKLLSICEALRRTGETTLNETSSRSHQILRLTIESSAREFLGKDNSTTLAASVNFVDLAGSERASQALSAGARLKEGCHINRSLLTLGTVIRKLSKGRHGHVNYRDSKLTRILQPSLGGNARTAIICTLSPARSHVEQSRNTLLFASCAKEVSTNAQVNVVMSDKALLKHLQKEVARLESELRSPVPCDYAALMRKKDLQIEKMEKEIRELTMQRDLAQSRVEDLLQVIGSNQPSRRWEDEYSVSESLGVADSNCLNSEGTHRQLIKNTGDRSLYDDASSALSTGIKFYRSDLIQGRDDSALATEEAADDLCKEVRCIEMDDSGKSNSHESNAFFNGEDEGMSDLTASGSSAGTHQQMISNSPMGISIGSHIQNGFTYGILEQKMHDVQNTIDSLVCHYPEEPSPGALALARSRSCRANLMNGSSSPCSELIQNSPPNGSERDFPGRPEGFRGKYPPLNYNMAGLSRNDSQSSAGSAFVDDLKGHNNRTAAEEDITSIHTFVAGLKEAQLQYEKQLGNGQEMGSEADNPGKNVKDVGLDPMQDLATTASDWPQEFERQQKLILELWQSCNVSLVHRTYFFLLFKGDPTDSIYMEVELRRLTFLEQSFSRGNQAVADGQTLTVASSIKALRREREMLVKLMQRRLSEYERNRLYHKWGIGLSSKRRRVQLVTRLWSNAKDMNHVTESAALVAKLVKFSEQGQTLKQMLGLAFTLPCTKRRSNGWIYGMTTFM